MVSIKVKYRPSVVEGGAGSIYYQIIHARKVRMVSTRYKVHPSEWDEERSMPVCVARCARASALASMREQIRCEIERFRRIARRFEADGPAYTIYDIVDEFERYGREYSLFNYMESRIISLRQKARTRTSETYRAALSSFKKFRHGEDIMLDAVTPEVMEAYEAYLKINGNTPNTISFYMRILRAVYNRAAEEGAIENRMPFRHVYTGIEKTVKRALPISVIKKMKSLDLSLQPRMEYARDMFLMSFFLRGMSFIDMAFLNKSDLSGGYITYRRRKTGQQLKIKWTKEMQMILDKYPRNPIRFLLPIITRPGVNERSAYRSQGYNINRHLKEVASLLGIDMKLTMYCARHSWASAARSNGIPLGVISEGMGHDSEATTQIYLASLDTSIVDRANSLILKSLD